MNNTGVYRSFYSVIRQEISNSITPFTPSYKNGEMSFSNATDSESSGSYYNNLPLGSLVIAFDLFANGTLVSSSVSQSINAIRMRMVKLCGWSTMRYEVGIASSYRTDTNIPASQQRLSRIEIFNRFLFLMLEKAFYVSRDSCIIDGRLIIFLLNTAVPDQPLERSFFCSKGAQNYMDCSICLMPFKQYANRGQASEFEAYNESYEDSAHSPSIQISSSNSVFQRHIYGPSSRNRDARKGLVSNYGCRSEPKPALNYW